MRIRLRGSAILWVVYIHEPSERNFNRKQAMLRFTKRADYGLIAVHYIASHGDEGAVSAKRIADEFHIPQERLAKILQRLAKKQLIESHNGPKGGYVLTREPEQITVGQVLRALEGPVRIVSCMVENDDCPQFSRCNLRRPVEKIQASISYFLDNVTMAELAADVPRLAAIN